MGGVVPTLPEVFGFFLFAFTFVGVFVSIVGDSRGREKW